MRRLRLNSRVLAQVTLVLIAAAVIILAYWSTWSRPEEDATIRWVRQNGLCIDYWQAGELPGPEFDEQAWIRVGRAIPNVEDVLQRLLQRKTRGVHPILLVQGLGYVGTSRSVPLLAAQLGDGWEVMRRKAIWALGRIGGPEARSLLETQVRRAATFSERQAAAQGLADAGDDNTIDVLSQLIQRHQEEERILMEVIRELRHKGIGPHQEDATGGKPSEVPAGTEHGVAGLRCPLSQPSAATAPSSL